MQPRLQLLILGRRVHRSIGLLPNTFVQVGEGLRRETGCRRGERCIDKHTAIVDFGVEHPHVLLRCRQRLQLWVLMPLAFDRHIMPVVGIQFRPQFRRIDPIDLGGVLAAPRLARLPHDANNLFPGGVLSVHQTKNFCNTLETARIGVVSPSDIVQTCRSTGTIGQRCCGAKMPSSIARSNAAPCATQDSPGQRRPRARLRGSDVPGPSLDWAVTAVKLTHNISVDGCSA